MDRVDKTESCANLVDVACHQLGKEASWGKTNKIQHKDGTVEDRVANMMDARSFMRPVDASWDAVLDNMADNLEVSKFGAEGTAPEPANTCCPHPHPSGNTRTSIFEFKN